MSKTSTRIEALRKECGKTRAELSREMGVSKTTIQKWEDGTTTPRKDKLSKLSRLFQVSETYLLGFSDIKEIGMSSYIEAEKIVSTTEDNNQLDLPEFGNITLARYIGENKINDVRNTYSKSYYDAELYEKQTNVKSQIKSGYFEDLDKYEYFFKALGFLRYPTLNKEAELLSKFALLDDSDKNKVLGYISAIVTDYDWGFSST